MTRLVVFCALAAIVGGALRIVAPLMTPMFDAPATEALYAVIDLGMLFGLVGVYVQTADRLGPIALVAFVTAFAALASIVGPDPTLFGIDFYRMGASVFSVALGAFATTLAHGRMHRTAAGLWMISPAMGATALILTGPWLAGAGMTLGAGFVFAGLASMREVRSALAAGGRVAGKQTMC